MKDIIKKEYKFGSFDEHRNMLVVSNEELNTSYNRNLTNLKFTLCKNNFIQINATEHFWEKTWYDKELNDKQLRKIEPKYVSKRKTLFLKRIIYYINGYTWYKLKKTKDFIWSTNNISIEEI